MKIKLILVDDHKLFRIGLKAFLKNEKELEIIGEADNGFEAIKIVQEKNADIILLDISLPGLSGITVAQEIRKIKPNIKIIVLTMHEDKFYLQELLKLGVNGFILKKSTGEILLEAINTVYNGDYYIDPHLSKFIVESFQNQNHNKLNRVEILTKRELDVCKLLALGYTNKEIAKKLHISVRTVETHRKNIMDKLQLKSRAEIVKFAIEHNLIKF